MNEGRCNRMIPESSSVFAGMVRCGRPMDDLIHDPLWPDRRRSHWFDNVPVCDGEDPGYEVVES